MLSSRVIPRRPGARLLLLLLGAVLALGLGAAPGTASETEACVPDPETGCIFGTLKLKDAAGVEITVSGAGGEQTVETDESGKWSAAVTEAGSYEVSLNEDTLPEGVKVKGPATRTVNANLGSQTIGLFNLEGEGATSASNTSDSTKFDQIKQQVASGLRLGLLLALASIGLSLIYGTTGLSNFAHAEQVTLGGVLAYAFANVMGLNLLLAGAITIFICASTGYIQDRLLWQPLRGRGLGLTQLMIVTIGLSIAMQYTFQYFIGAGTVRIETANPDVVEIWGIRLTAQSYVAMGVAVVAIAASGWFLLRTRTGRATRAVSDNPALAAASGIDVNKVIRLVWILATGLAGLSGIMLGLVLNGVSWQFGLQILLLMFSAVTLGGLGTAFGALVGSLIIGMVVELTNLVLPGDFKYATALLILIVLLMVRPQGIVGRRERVG